MSITTEEAEQLAEICDQLGGFAQCAAALRSLAAERDRLRAENEKLREALKTARRDALEEAARAAEDCDHPWVEAREAEHEAAALMAGRIADAIRALKGEGDE